MIIIATTNRLSSGGDSCYQASIVVVKSTFTIVNGLLFGAWRKFTAPITSRLRHCNVVHRYFVGASQHSFLRKCCPPGKHRIGKWLRMDRTSRMDCITRASSMLCWFGSYSVTAGLFILSIPRSWSEVRVTWIRVNWHDMGR
jgi:hypothetical protein